MREEIAHRHDSAALEAYTQGDIEVAVNNLSISLDFAPSWLAANNLAYILLKTKDLQRSVDWSKTAAELPCGPKDLALTKFNLAMASLQSGNMPEAKRYLDEASEHLSSVPFTDRKCPYLLVPKLEQSAIVLLEKPQVNLPEAIANAIALIDLVEHLQETR
jgi:hypothetical protein